MSVNKIFVTSLTVLFLSMFSLSFVSAQEVNTTSDNNNTSTQTINGGEEPLDGMNVSEPQSVPSGFGLWLRDWREKISVALTFDPVKKAEKLLLFAEERMKIAEKIMAESTNPNAQDKAAKMIEQAQKHIEQIQARQAKWEAKDGERVERLKNNLATHELRKDEILAKIEDRLPEDAKERFGQVREQALEKAKELIGNIDDDEQISEKTKEHLIDVRERIEANRATVSEYRDQKKEILKESDLSKEQLQDQIRLLWEQRKNKMEEIRLRYKEEQQNLKNTLEKPDEADKIKMERLKKARELMGAKNELMREYTKKLFELSRENMSREELQKKVLELKAELEKKIQELEKKDGIGAFTNAIINAKQRAEDIRDRAQTEKVETEEEIEDIETSN